MQRLIFGVDCAYAVVQRANEAVTLRLDFFQSGDGAVAKQLGFASGFIRRDDRIGLHPVGHRVNGRLGEVDRSGGLVMPDYSKVRHYAASFLFDLSISRSRTWSASDVSRMSSNSRSPNS